MVRYFLFKWSKIVALLPVLISMGCIGYLPLNKADPDTRQNVSEETIVSIIPGQTNKDDILLQLGEPDEVSPDGRRLIYSWNKIKGVAWYAIFGGYSGSIGHETFKKQYRMVITFDEKGVVLRKNILEEELSMVHKELFSPSKNPLPLHYAFYADDYVTAFENVAALSSLLGNKLNVGSFTSSEPDKSEIKCRLVGPVRPPFGDPFSEYIREAFIAELRKADIFSLDAPLILTGHLARIDFDSIVGKWEICLTVGSSSGKSITKAVSCPFASALFGESGCKVTAQAFMPAVQKLIHTILQSPEFAELVSE